MPWMARFWTAANGQKRTVFLNRMCRNDSPKPGADLQPDAHPFLRLQSTNHCFSSDNEQLLGVS
jgi:hypothetical protein